MFMAGLLGIAPSAIAQTMQPSGLTAPPVSNPTESAALEPTATQPPVIEPTESQSGSAVSASVRRLHYTLKLDVRGTYDDNIALTQTNHIHDYSLRIDPVISFSFGEAEASGSNSLHFEYDPDIILYLDHSNLDALQHVIHFGATSHLSRLTLGVTEEAQFLHGTDVNQFTQTGTFVNSVNLDVRGRPEVNTFNTGATAAYDLTGKTSLSAGGQWSITDYSQFTSSQTVSGSLYLSYAFQPKLSVGVGGTGGRQLVDEPTPDQTFEQANVRLSYEVTGKVQASGSAGIEFRQVDTGTNDYFSPVFELGLYYEPFDGSAFSLSGSRRTTSSASLVGQDFISTQFTASWRQRLLQRLSVSFTGGYENLTYFNVISGVNSTRDDNYYFIEPAIDVRITRYWSAGGYYLHRENTSSLSGFGFNDNQTGFRTTLIF